MSATSLKDQVDAGYVLGHVPFDDRLTTDVVAVHLFRHPPSQPQIDRLEAETSLVATVSQELLKMGGGLEVFVHVVVLREENQ